MNFGERLTRFMDHRVSDRINFSDVERRVYDGVWNVYVDLMSRVTIRIGRVYRRTGRELQR